LIIALLAQLVVALKRGRHKLLSLDPTSTIVR
jgi:hypothetical protein